MHSFSHVFLLIFPVSETTDYNPKYLDTLLLKGLRRRPTVFCLTLKSEIQISNIEKSFFPAL